MLESCWVDIVVLVVVVIQRVARAGYLIQRRVGGVDAGERENVVVWVA